MSSAVGEWVILLGNKGDKVVLEFDKFCFFEEERIFFPHCFQVV